MDELQFRRCIRAASAAESLALLGPTEWVDLASQLLALGRKEQEVLDLAILTSPASGWLTEPIVNDLHDRLALERLPPEEATLCFARVLADDLRQRPVTITSPMIRMLARTAPPDFSSKLAVDCFGAEEYLDCNCVAEVDPRFELELEGLDPTGLPDTVVEVIARRAKQLLPMKQPPHDH